MEQGVDRIASHLAGEPLRPAYLVAGPETLLVLEAADAELGVPWALVRHGRLCHTYATGGEEPSEALRTSAGEDR